MKNLVKLILSFFKNEMVVKNPSTFQEVLEEKVNNKRMEESSKREMAAKEAALKIEKEKVFQQNAVVEKNRVERLEKEIMNALLLSREVDECSNRHKVTEYYFADGHVVCKITEHTKEYLGSEGYSYMRYGKSHTGTRSKYGEINPLSREVRIFEVEPEHIPVELAEKIITFIKNEK